MKGKRPQKYLPKLEKRTLELTPGGPEVLERGATARAAPQILDFQGQLSRINRILHGWLDVAETTDIVFIDGKPVVPLGTITKLIEGLHRNLSLTAELMRLLVDIYEKREFQKSVLDALQEVSPDLRVKVHRALQARMNERRLLKPEGEV